MTDQELLTVAITLNKPVFRAWLATTGEDELHRASHVLATQPAIWRYPLVVACTRIEEEIQRRRAARQDPDYLLFIAIYPSFAAPPQSQDPGDSL